MEKCYNSFPARAMIPNLDNMITKREQLKLTWKLLLALSLEEQLIFIKHYNSYISTSVRPKTIKFEKTGFDLRETNKVGTSDTSLSKLGQLNLEEKHWKLLMMPSFQDHVTFIKFHNSFLAVVMATKFGLSDR